MWPFRRSVALPVVRADWRTLPPLQRVVGAHPLINPVGGFSSRLASWQNPSSLAPLGHVVSAGAPSGSVSGVVSEAVGGAGVFPAAPVVARAVEAGEPSSVG
ncbi:hypothetical protein [Lentzea guizhouensis]|uniref:hypothetical protein n=1 Tax=Lentzea guizhouensis TaxID=1586287 RepID=UPI0012B69BEE|nr:hypothetical protein [Lentzea guizhouensis]